MKTLAAAMILSGLLIVTISVRAADVLQSNDNRNTSLTSAEQLLVTGSRDAILETGITRSYFDSHFKLLEVVDKPADHRVTWSFTVNGYRALVRDAIGFYTQGTQRVYTHNVGARLGQTTEIEKTLPRIRVLKILHSCLGSFTAPSIEYGPVNGRAELMMVAYSAPRRSREGKAESRREREKRNRSIVASDRDVVEGEGGESKAPILMATVNLQTGECRKGVALLAP